ncbi:WD repeat-containing protein 81-like [Pollicipes pollicipes]|uniref:WD repeat-containing protein 81-like n=1 Tax=Pollicipes pollicipes TaxID=41117 RepID=UPI001884E7C0|nr:WD repeat-containing protein 81-like [Pollicipes pollicipes]
MNNGSRHLRGAWQAYWLNELAQVDAHLNPKQIRVQGFDGHSGAVREMHVLDNENSFVSASRDKTVKLWSIRSQGDGSQRSTPQWTYSQHRRPVLGATYLPARQRVASCDPQTLHLWDPFIGAADAQVELGSISVMAAVPAPCPYLFCGSSEPSLRLVDTRIGAAVCTWKGALAVLDLRTGTVRAAWKAHEAEVRQVAALDDASLVTCSVEPSLTVWETADGAARTTLRGSEPGAVFSSTKLKPECFKGVLSSMALLSANRLLLLGSDQGSIRLIY